MAVLFVVGIAALMVAPLWLQPEDTLQLGLGDVPTEDILAPVSLTYVSDIQTDAARDAAEAAVEDVYRAPDTRIVRQQVTLARNVLNFISNVRADNFATANQKLSDLTAVRDVMLDAATWSAVLALNDSQWAALQPEVPRVIEVVMSASVTEPRLADARAQVPQIVSVNLSVTEAELVAALAQPLIVPNSAFDEAATVAAQQAARDAVAPVTVTFVQGQTVVERGRVINALDLEAMQKLGLLDPPEAGRWQDPVARLSAAVLAVLVLGGFVWRVRPQLRLYQRDLLLVELLFLGLVALAAWLTPSRTVAQYLIPVSGVGMLISLLLGPQLAMLAGIVFGVLVGVLAEGQMDLGVYLALGTVMAVIVLGRAERVTSFFGAGLVAAVMHWLVVLAFRLADPTFDTLGLITLLLAGLANGAVSATVALLGVLMLGPLFDLTTSLRLIDLMRPDHPLLKELLREAPGTYQHSLQVANLSEQAAEAIDANAMLCRVGSMYHDIGKIRHAIYFVENLAGEENPHDRLDPMTSAQIIIGHVTEGLTMGRKARLPGAILACIAEHHGTGITWYQYNRAQALVNGELSKVRIEDYMYPGPKPQSRETAIMMLADGCEAKSRADLPTTEAEVREIVDTIFEVRLQEGQLDESGLTLGEIEVIRESFVKTLKGVYHARIKYPPQLDAKLEPAKE